MGQTGFLLLVLAAFAVSLVAMGTYTRKWVHDASDYLLGGREVSLLVNTFGVAAIGFAGTSIALGPAFAISHGFWASMAFAILYSLGGLALYGIVFAKFIRRCGAQTLPEWLELRFDSRVRFLVTVTTILGLIGITANNVVSLTGVLTGYTGWPLPLVISGVFLTFLVFCYAGGFWAVTLTDFAQMIIGLIAVPLLFVMCVSLFGGLDWLAAEWPGPDMWTAGFTGETLPVFSLRYPSLLTFLLLFSAFLVWGNNYYWLRVASARSERTARLSYIYAGVLLVLVIYVPLAFAGLYVVAAHPDLFFPNGQVPPVAAFGVLVRDMPLAVAAFLLVGASAASISTATTAHLGATATAVRDIYQRVLRPQARPHELVRPTKVILFLLGILIWLLSFYPGGPVYLFAFSTAWLGPPSLLVLLGAFWRRFSASGAFWGALAGMVSMSILTLLELMGYFVISTTMHVGVVGIVVTLAVALIVTFLTRPKYYGLPDWQPLQRGTGGTIDTVRAADMELAGADETAASLDLTELDRAVLDRIRRGYDSMAELADLLALDAADVNAVIEKLEQAGYLTRLAGYGAGFYTFRLTPVGEKAAGVPSREEQGILERGLDSERVEVLQAVSSPEMLRQMVASGRYTSLQLSTIVNRLIRDGYLTESGLWRRVITVTPAGREVLASITS